MAELAALPATDEAAGKRLIHAIGFGVLTQREQIAIVPTADAPAPVFVDATRGKIFAYRPDGTITSPACNLAAFERRRRPHHNSTISRRPRQHASCIQNVEQGRRCQRDL